jgi:hypothetical protein
MPCQSAARDLAGRLLRFAGASPRGTLYWSTRRLARGARLEDRIYYFERMLAENPDNPTGLLALANDYQKGGRDKDEAAVLEC